MAILPGEGYAAAFREVFSWFTSRDGFERLTREMKVEKLLAMQKVCLDNRDTVGADLVYAKLRELSLETGD